MLPGLKAAEETQIWILENLINLQGIQYHMNLYYKTELGKLYLGDSLMSLMTRTSVNT